jgi:hypothetical protein
MPAPYDPDHDPVTPERIAPASPRRIAILVAGVIGFALCVNVLALVVLRMHPTNGGHWILRQKWLILHRAPDVDTLLLGDSTCNQGVKPAVLSETLGGSAINLCTIGDMLAVNDVWMLEAYLRTHHKPRRVVIIHTADMWQRDAGDRFAMLLGEIPLEYGFWKHFALPLDLSVGERALFVADRWVPLYSDEKTLRSWISSPAEQIRFHMALSPDGYMAVKSPKPKMVEADARLHRADLDGPWKPSAINQRALRTLVELAAKDQIEVVIVPGPMYVGLWQDPRMQLRYAQIESWIRSIVGSSPWIRVVDAPPATFRADQMGNVDHVIDAAANDYTRWVATHISR